MGVMLGGKEVQDGGPRERLAHGRAWKWALLGGVPYVTGEVNADEGFLVFHNN